MNLIKISVLIFVFACSLFPQQNLTLGEAILLAKKNNSEYIIAKLNKLKAERKISEVYSENLLPTLTLNSRYIRSFKKQTINIFGQNFELGTDNSITTSFDVSEPIPVLGTPVFTGIRIAQYYSSLQDENILQTEAKIKADVTKTFNNILLLQQVVELNKQSIDNAQENLRVVEARYNAGVALEFDVIRARVRVETLKPQLSQAENNLQIAYKVFKNTIGLKQEGEIGISGSLVYDSTEVWGTMDNLIRNISSNNVAIRQLNLTKKINQELTDVDHANYLPKIYLFGQYGLQANENDDRGITKYRFFNSLTAGIGLTWDLNLFRNSYKEDQSIIEVKKTEELILHVKEQLKTQTESVVLRIEDAKQRIKAQKELVMQAERGYELANTSYKSGVLNQIDVVDAELGLRQVKLLYLQAIFDYLTARTDLEQLLEK